MSSPLISHGLELSEPLRDLGAWTARLQRATIPVLRDTADSLEAFRANEDGTDANSIGEMIANDPLMTLKVLAYESEHRGRRVVTSAETVTSALVMMGISPFFRAFGAQPMVEDWLGAGSEALAGLHAVLRRAHRGADFALAFAIHRVDPDAAVIHAATLLHEFAELLLWCHAPVLALRIQRAQAVDPELRSNAAQRAVLNVELCELQRSLAMAWRLPGLIADIASEPHPAGHTSARLVSVGARLARHTTCGWSNPAIPDDIAEIAELLNLSHEAAMGFVCDI